MSWMNAGNPIAITKAISSVAANAEQEKMVGTFSQDVRIIAAYLIPDTAMVTDTDSGYALDLAVHDTGGTLATTVATYTATTAAGTNPATVRVPLTVITSQSTVTAGKVLTYKERTIGTGTARSNGQLVVEYTIQ